MPSSLYHPRCSNLYDALYSVEHNILNRSYDAFLIIICVFGVTCFNVKKRHYFYNSVHYCRSSLKRFVFYKPLLPTSGVCSDWPADPVHCDWPNTTSTRGIEINRSIDALQCRRGRFCIDAVIQGFSNFFVSRTPLT